MRNLGLAVVLACAAVGLTAVSMPPVDDLALGQTKCGNDMCAGSKTTRWRFGGNVSVASPDGGFTVSETGAVTAPSVTTSGTATLGTSKVAVLDAGVGMINGNLQILGKVPTLRADVVDAGVLYLQGFGPMYRLIPFTTAATDLASTTTTCTDSGGTTATGARTGDTCTVGMPSTLTGAGTGLNGSYTCYVSAADTIKVRHCAAGTADDPGSVVYTGFVFSAAP